MNTICSNCGHVGEPRVKTRGSLVMEIVLWLAFIVPGLIYSVWCLTSKYESCELCGNATLLPLDSPLGKRLADEVGYKPVVRAPSGRAVAVGRSIGRFVGSFKRPKP